MTDEERLEFFGRLQSMGKPKKSKNYRQPKKRAENSNLVLQETVSPFDTYTYLHARFGDPNGMQTMLARNDSDNMFHWDYYLKAGEADLTFIGASEEVHVFFDGDFNDAQCREFIAAFKADFRRIGKDKGRFAGTLEKWYIIPNQFLSISNRCADLYYQITTALPKIERNILANRLTSQALIAQKQRKSHSKLMSAITTAPTELSVLMPVMFESFIGLIVAVLIKPEVRRDEAVYDAFIRSPLNQKLVDLAGKCNGFARQLEQNNPIFGRYWSVVNKRNDIIHGNVDPVRDALEVVYFHDKRPLYKSGGDRLRQHWQRLIDRYRPQEVVDDYLAMQSFILEIMDHMNLGGRRAIETVMDDTQPGWDNKRKIPGRLFPDHVATTHFEGLRYDWQL